MYMIETIEGLDHIRKEAMQPAPFGPGFKVVPLGATKMEVWCTSFEDPGPDYCEFRIMANERVLCTRRMGGY